MILRGFVNIARIGLPEWTFVWLGSQVWTEFQKQVENLSTHCVLNHKFGHPMQAGQ